MSVTAELLDKFKKARALVSDYSASTVLKTNRANISAWRKGTEAEPEMLAKMAEAIGEDPGIWIVRAQVNKTRSPSAAQAWQRHVLGKFAIALLVLCGATTGEKALSNPAGLNFTYSGQVIHYAHRFALWVARLSQRFAQIKPLTAH